MISQTLRFIFPSAPKARQLTFKQLWFSYSLERISFCISNQLIDSFQSFLISRLPKKILVPRFIIPTLVHQSFFSISSCKTPFPELNAFSQKFHITPKIKWIIINLKRNTMLTENSFNKHIYYRRRTNSYILAKRIKCSFIKTINWRRNSCLCHICQLLSYIFYLL